MRRLSRKTEIPLGNEADNAHDAGSLALLGDLTICVKAIAAGNLDCPPAGSDPLSVALRALIDVQKSKLSENLSGIVEQAVSANQTAITSGNMIAAAQKVDENVQGMAAATEELVASVGSIGASSDEAVASASEVAQASASGKTAADIASETMQKVHFVVSEATSKMERLAAASADIGDIVSTIDDIASKTNLLALNATIEAARAGEAGKGFAVVASEVKTLSNQTAAATQNIRERIERLQDETRSIAEDMEVGAETVTEGKEVVLSVSESMAEITNCAATVESHMNDISDTLSQQQAATAEVAEGISTIAALSKETLHQVGATSDAIDQTISRIGNEMMDIAALDIPGKVIQLAKADHVIWKKRLIDMVLGRESLRHEELADHHSCRLGKWYYGKDAQEYKKHEEFKRLEEPHALVHKHGIEATRLFNTGKVDAALAEIKKVEEASEDVMAILEKLRCIDNQAR
jgi:methyl-accepting chemotaxis protein